MTNKTTWWPMILVLAATVAWSAPLKVDLSANGQVEPGWVDWNSNGRMDNTNLERRFQNQANFDDDFTIRFTKVDTRNRAQMSDSVPLHDMLEDAFKEADPFTMTLVGLAPGKYVLITYDHDTNENVVNDDGTLNITLKDADGSRLVADHVQQTWGSNPDTVCSVTIPFRSDGSDIVLTLADNNDGIHNEAYLNGFILDVAVEPTKASAPEPADKATDVPLDVVLRWTAADSAAAVNGHKVYFSQSLDAVKTGAAAAAAGIVTAPEFDVKNLPLRLEYGMVYYWRVDEGSTTTGWGSGTVWSFTTEPVAYPIPSQAIVATASSWLNDNSSPGKTVDGSGLDKNDLHSTTDTDMWLAGVGGPQSTWLMYEFDKVYSLHEMWVWNHNQTVEPLFGLGLKDVLVESSMDGVNWTPLADTTRFARAPGTAGYAHDTVVPFGGVAAKSVRLTPKSSWGGGSQYGLSEVRFYYVPLQAREPQPAAGAADVGPEVTLTWRAGRQAASHKVYLSADAGAVEARTATAQTVTIHSFDAGTLQLNTTYFWCVDEVNEAQTPPVWGGDLWSFSTPEFLVVEDFESYNDDENRGTRIYETWIDGYADGSSGSTVGYIEPPFAERVLVQSGRQSMPLFYDNTTSAFSEAQRTFDTPQDWTQAGIQALVLHVRGEPNNTGGRLYVKINTTKIPYTGDAADVTGTRWTQWNIDLTTLGAKLKNVTKLTIGVEGGGSGKLYIDDIRLYPRRCVASVRQPEGDLNNDCVVDYRDVQIMAADWLTHDASLTAASAAPSATGLVAHYKLDGNVLDSSGNSLNGTLAGNPVYTPGVLGQALTFDGTGDAVDCTNHVKFDALTDAVTVTAWILVERFDVSYQPIVTKGDNTWRIARESETNGIQWRCNGPTPTLRVSGLTNVNDGEWHHVAGTYDGAVARLYVDGLPDGSVATTGAIAKNTEHVLIGANSQQAARMWKGAIDEVRIYSLALTEGEIRYVADRTPGDGKLYVPLRSPAELYDAEPANFRSINLKDFSQLADNWLDTQLWP